MDGSKRQFGRGIQMFVLSEWLVFTVFTVCLVLAFWKEAWKQWLALAVVQLLTRPLSFCLVAVIIGARDPFALVGAAFALAVAVAIFIGALSVHMLIVIYREPKEIDMSKDPLAASAVG